jgi:hypothetical protein
MMSASIEDASLAIILECVECGRDIDVCAFCDETSCGVALCYRDVNRLLGQSDPQPFRHGG